MADITYDAVSSTTKDGGTTVTWAHTVGSVTNRILVVGLMAENATTEANMTATGVTYNSVALTKIGAVTVSNTNRTELWYLVAPSTGANNIVATFTGANDYVVGGISFYNASQTAQPNVFNTGSNSDNGSTAVSTAATSTLANCMFVDAVQAGIDTRTLTVGGTQTQRVNAQNAGAIVGAMSNLLVAAAGSQAMEWSISTGSRWAHVVAAIAPVQSGSNFFMNLL